MKELTDELKKRIKTNGGVISLYSKRLESGVREEFYYAEYPTYRGWPINVMLHTLEPFMLTDEGMAAWLEDRKKEIDSYIDNSGAER